MSEIILNENNRDIAHRIIDALSPSRPWLLTVKPYVAKRSSSQNARLWLLHQKAAEMTGMSADEMHEIALCRFFGYEEKTIGGIIRQIPNERSSGQDKKRFNEFMEATEAFYISELGVFLD